MRQLYQDNNKAVRKQVQDDLSLLQQDKNGKSLDVHATQLLTF